MSSTLNIVDVTELAPVREALLQSACVDAEKELAKADRDVEDLSAEAAAEATQLLDRASAHAADDVVVLEAAERSRVLREARSVQLRARLATYEALVSAATAAVRDQLADDPSVTSALVTRARTELGADAVLSRLPDGGLVAEAGGRRLALPLQALVERVVADLIAAQESS